MLYIYIFCGSEQIFVISEPCLLMLYTILLTMLMGLYPSQHIRVAGLIAELQDIIPYHLLRGMSCP
jgi:hypothetical protein